MSATCCHLLLLAAIATTPVADVGVPAPTTIKPEPIARAARHPGPLVVREAGSGEIPPAYGTPLWAANVTAAGAWFADLNILLLKGGAFLTPAVTARFEQALAAPQRYAPDIEPAVVAEDRTQAERQRQEIDRLRAQGPLIQPVSLPDGRRGYSAVLGLSRTATTVATILPSPDGRYDLLVSVAIPFEQSGQPVDPVTGRYRTRLYGQPLDSVQEMALSIYRQLFPAQRKRSRP